MLIANAALSAILQVIVLAGLPFLGYFIYQKWRNRRTLSQVLKRAGLQGCSRRYLLYSLAFAVISPIVLVLWSPPLELFTREGSAQRQFAGLGFGLSSLSLAFFYGVVQTGFTEEFLFRGLIAGSLSRRLPLVWANVVQAGIFLLPHFLILTFAPELWGLLPLVFVGALLFGWIRMKSGSILGPWLMHSAGNVTIALMVAFRTPV